MPYSFSNEPSGSFTCPVYSTDTWDLGLKSHPNDLVPLGIELTTPGITILRQTKNIFRMKHLTGVALYQCLTHTEGSFEKKSGIARISGFSVSTSLSLGHSISPKLAETDVNKTNKQKYNYDRCFISEYVSVFNQHHVGLKQLNFSWIHAIKPCQT